VPVAAERSCNEVVECFDQVVEQPVGPCAGRVEPVVRRHRPEAHLVLTGLVLAEHVRELTLTLSVRMVVRVVAVAAECPLEVAEAGQLGNDLSEL
jgi:hypothetical protein